MNTEWIVMVDDEEDGEAIFDGRYRTIEAAEGRLAELGEQGYPAWIEREETPSSPPKGQHQ